MTFLLPKLAYAYDSLEPWIDAQTMEIHHSKHHRAYTDKFNSALEKHPELFSKKADELIKDLDKVPEDIRAMVKNHGGGFVNHSLFWEIMTPDKEKRELNGKIKEEIEKKWGTFEKFREKFSNAAAMHFGSGWIWLVVNNGKLEIMSTANQDSPLSEGKIPILTLDVWEHAYYLKYQNKRADYISAWWNVVNWKKVDELFYF